MYTAARRPADRTRVRHAAVPTTAARATPPPAAEHIGDITLRPAVSRGTAPRDEALGATLARAVAERAHAGSGMGHPPGATLQRFLGIGKKKKPPRPTQALPAPARPKQALPAPARPKQALPPSAAASPSIVIPGAVPQALIDLGARRFDLGSEMDPFEARQFDMDPFEARQFNLEADPPAFAPPPPAMQPEAPAAVDDGFAPELVPDETGLVPVAGNPYLEWLVSSYASDRGAVMTPRSFGALRNLQVIASLAGYPKPRPIDPRYLAATSTAYDWGFAY